MITYIDKHRGEYGVEPICDVLQFAPAHLLRGQVPAAVGLAIDA